jgi:hypothetical protein
MPRGIKLAPEFFSQTGAELRSGLTVQTSTLSVPLKELDSVKVRLELESPKK